MDVEASVCASIACVMPQMCFESSRSRWMRRRSRSWPLCSMAEVSGFKFRDSSAKFPALLVGMARCAVRRRIPAAQAWESMDAWGSNAVPPAARRAETSPRDVCYLPGSWRGRIVWRLPQNFELWTL